MPAAQHNKAQDKLTASVPGSGEAIRVPRDPYRDPDRAVSRHDLEDNIEHGKRHRVCHKIRGLNRGDHQDCQHQPPDVVSQLPVDLLADEADAAVSFAAAAAWAVRCRTVVGLIAAYYRQGANTVLREGLL
ncbi:hypothetical protein FOWG_17486 [Fusarium oxysporum f. sp. lycopersici MN25]|nr:hypothetical protein FOWG_17486 [Fusarium oxysporum f. sp. lycopersici MN25]